MSDDTRSSSFAFEIPAGLKIPLECPAHRRGVARRPDEIVLDEMLRWFRERLPCVAGRREFNKQRYMIEIATGDDIFEVFNVFVSAIQTYPSTACLFVFNQPDFYDGRGDAKSAFAFLASKMAQLGNSSPSELAEGGALSNTIRLKCPVTGVQTDFDDFECIAFCPQSSNIYDPLYDPLMSAPYSCVDMSSDVFAFSYFVMESAIAKFGKTPYEIRHITILAPSFATCVERWHKIASSTIGNFAAITDTSRCPVHITEDASHWIAAHRDPAFAETMKIPHRHELPTIYATRIVDAWTEYFADGRYYQATGLAREGMLQ